MKSALRYKLVRNSPVFQSHLFDIIDLNHLGVVQYMYTSIHNMCMHSSCCKLLVAKYLESLILWVKHEPDSILSQIHHHVLIKGKLMQLGGKLEQAITCSWWDSTCRNYSQIYLFTVLQLYVLDGGALLLEYLHSLSQRHAYEWGKKYIQFVGESR